MFTIAIYVFVVYAHTLQIEEARRKIVDENTAILDFGSKADEICAAAIEEFAKNAPSESEGSSASSA